MCKINDVVRKELMAFAEDFSKNPYRCYTEHGIHALFFNGLMNSFSANEISQYFKFKKVKVCRLQKEYRTKGNLGKSQRQNWDIAVINADKKIASFNDYDYLPLKAVIEFGLNEGLEHLEDDLQRLSHKDANVDFKYVGHFYRISNPKLSKRDKGIKNKKIMKPSEIAKLSKEYPEVEIVLAVSNKKGASGVCVMRGGDILSNTIQEGGLR